MAHNFLKLLRLRSPTWNAMIWRVLASIASHIHCLLAFFWTKLAMSSAALSQFSFLMLGFRVLCDQQLNERMQQRFASLSSVVHKLEKTEVKGEFLLGNAPMWAKPAPQQRPEPFHGIHMDFTKAIAIFTSGVLSSSMVDALMVVSPRTQASINAVFIRVYQGTWGNGL